MKTYHLHAEYVGRYADDLLRRVMTAFPGDDGARVGPEVWLCLGSSGVFATKALLSSATEDLRALFEEKGVRVAVAQADRSSHSIVIPESSDTKIEDLRGRRVLLVDSHVNTGQTMLQAVEWLREQAMCADVSTFAVAVRPTAAIIPNHFSVLVGIHDRILVPEGTDAYQEDQLVNHRLESTTGIFRRLTARDLDRAKVVSGVGALDRASWADYWYDICTDPSRHVVVLEVGSEIVAYVSYSLVPSGQVVIDEVATSETALKSGFKGAGSSLCRWVESHARAQQCSHLALWAKDGRQSFYEKLMYEPTGRKIDLGPDGLYFEMARPVVPGAWRG